ncbi:MAG: NTP transferase domain-containing protein [Crenarchaeota archaeon]|nr:NTP transferase domain-containing protein [Thermoproteota archaeon]
MKAILLAAGEGTRLLPITATRPKHLIQVAGKAILEYSIDALKANGILEFLIMTNYMQDAIRDYFGDGSKFGVKISYVKQEALLGTGNAVSIVESYVEDDFLLIYGDLIFTAEAIRDVLDKYEAGKTDAVLAVVKVDRPESYGVIKYDLQKKFEQIVEKPKKGLAPSNLANAGLYVFTREIFGALRKVKRSVRGEWELTDAVTMLAQEGKTIILAEICKDNWFDVGRPWDLLDANVWALKRMKHRVLGVVEPNVHLIGPVTVAKTARVRSGAYIEGPCLIDEGADVGPNCFIRPYTTLGKNTRVGNACEIKNSIIMEGTHVGHLSYVGDSILCEKCNLGAGTITANLLFNDGNVKMVIKENAVDSGRRKLGVIFGDNVKTGVNSVFMPGIKVGENTWVGPNLCVEQDLPANIVALLKQDWFICKKEDLP